MAKNGGSAGKRRRLGRGLSSLIGEPVEVPIDPPVADQPRGNSGGGGEKGRGWSGWSPDADTGSHDPLEGGRAAGAGAAAGTGADVSDGGSGGGGGGGSGGEGGRGGVVLGIALDRISPCPYQPRSGMDATGLEQLASSIREAGVIQPVVVRHVSGDRFELVAGERRWRAAGIAGLERVPAIVVELSDQEAAQWSLIENLQREDLNPIERAEAFGVLVERFGLTHGEVGERVGLDRSSVANLVRLMELEEPIRALIGSGRLSAGHGKALLSMLDIGVGGAERIALAERAARAGWSVRRLEREAGASRKAESTGGGDARSAIRSDLEKRIGEHLGTRVRIQTRGDGRRGRISIEFYDLDHFETLLSTMGLNTGS